MISIIISAESSVVGINSEHAHTYVGIYIAALISAVSLSREFNYQSQLLYPS
jgi:hypothetical protein